MTTYLKGSKDVGCRKCGWTGPVADLDGPGENLCPDCGRRVNVYRAESSRSRGRYVEEPHPGWPFSRQPVLHGCARADRCPDSDQCYRKLYDLCPKGHPWGPHGLAEPPGREDVVRVDSPESRGCNGKGVLLDVAREVLIYDGEDSPAKPLFIPLRGEYFDAFESGEKDTELRRQGNRWNLKTCFPGRAVMLSRGYGKYRRLKGVVQAAQVRPGYTLAPAERKAVIACYGRDDINVIRIRITGISPAGVENRQK